MQLTIPRHHSESSCLFFHLREVKSPAFLKFFAWLPESLQARKLRSDSPELEGGLPDTCVQIQPGHVFAAVVLNPSRPPYQHVLVCNG